jgi:hypothetical protein
MQMMRVRAHKADDKPALPAVSRLAFLCACGILLAACTRAPPAACWLIAVAGQARAAFAAPAKGAHATAWSMQLLLSWALTCVVPSSLAWCQVLVRQGWRHLPRATLPDGIMGVPAAVYGLQQLLQV